jgi:hypothetical protein
MIRSCVLKLELRLRSGYDGAVLARAIDSMWQEQLCQLRT